MVFLLVLITVGTVLSETLYVAAAASLRGVLPELVREFRKNHPGVDVRITFGASGSLFAKIKGGAPYQVFLSADAHYPKRLIEEGLALKDSYLEYGKGRIVLFYTKGEFKEPKDILRAKKIALPNPKHAPYGVAAVQFLKRSGLWDRVKDKVVYGANVSQTVQFVITGAAEVGITALSMVKNLRKGRYIHVPEHLYEPVVHSMVLTLRGKNSKVAWEFLRFMGSKEAKKILRESGLEVSDG